MINSIIAIPATYDHSKGKDTDAYNDTQFFKYYEGKIGASFKSLNPFVKYELTDNDYEKILEKTKIRSLKLASGFKVRQPIRKIKKKHFSELEQKRKINKSVASLNAPRTMLPELSKGSSNPNLSLSSSKKELINEQYKGLLNFVEKGKLPNFRQPNIQNESTL